MKFNVKIHFMQFGRVTLNLLIFKWLYLMIDFFEKNDAGWARRCRSPTCELIERFAIYCFCVDVLSGYLLANSQES